MIMVQLSLLPSRHAPSRLDASRGTVSFDVPAFDEAHELPLVVVPLALFVLYALSISCTGASSGR